MKAYADIYKSEIDGFKQLMEQFLAGEITVPEFKGKSGGFGVYAQRDKTSFMIRLRTSSGVITYEHMDLIQKYIKQYGCESIHLTTRQAVQLHDLSVDEVCEIMKDAIDYDLFTRGGGGNYPRNVAMSPMTGVEKGEAFDVYDCAMLLNEYFIANASKYHLPRKLKVAYSNSAKDTASATINDVGFVAVVKDNKPYFRVFLTGGMGNNPALSFEYHKMIEPWEAIYYVEAFTQAFMELGNYKNRAKARSRYIPREIGEEAFVACLEKHLAEVMKEHDFEKIQVTLQPEEAWDSPIENTRNLVAQKQKDLYTVILHPRFGKMSAKEYGDLCEFIHKVVNDGGKPALRITMEEEMYVLNLSIEQANELLDIMKENNGTTDFTTSFSCVGVPTCQIGVQNSRALWLSIMEAVENTNVADNLLPCIHISGCGNSCSRHQVASLGFAGKKQSIHGEKFDVFEVHAGGKIGLDETHMGKIYGTITVDNIPGFILELAEKLEECEMCFDKFYEAKEEEFAQLISKFLVVTEK